MAPKLYGFAGNSRVRRVLATAALAGVELEYDSSFTMKSNWKEDIKGNPLSTLPFLEDGDLRLAESAAIAEYVAELGPNQTLIPSDPKEKARVHQYTNFADQGIWMYNAAVNAIFSNAIPYTKPAYTAAVERVVKQIEKLEPVLLNSTFLVGERITLADIYVATALVNAFTGHISADLRKRIPNSVRLAETVINHPKLAPIFDNGNVQFVETAPAYVPPAKEQKAKEPKAPQAAAQPKAEKKPKKKDEDEDEDIELAPAEPKAKNPLDDLPKSNFNLEEWKRQYSNLDTRKEALPWFYEKFDKEGFSIWRVDFKYNDELTQVFMSSNQIGGFFNRLEASRKYLFGSVGVLGKANDSIISGALITRGKDFKPVIEVAPDWESYEYKEINLDNADDKAFFEAAMAWDLVVDGKEWADGKNFK